VRKEPWWYATRTTRQSLGLGLVWIVLAAAQWGLLIGDDVAARRVVSPVITSVLATAYLASWVFRRRRERNREHSR